MKKRKGFTLIELLVVITVLGILMAIAIPIYTKSMETARFNSAVGATMMVASANKILFMDYPTSWPLTSNGPLADAHNSGATCPSSGKPASLNEFIACKYLSPHNWSKFSYNIYVCNPSAVGSDCCSAVGRLACATRKSGSSSPYSAWTFYINTLGQCTAEGTDVPPCPQTDM